MIFRTRLPDGTLRMLRPAYKPGAYAVSDKILAELRQIPNLQSFEEATTGHEGMLLGYTRLETFERDGHTWYQFQANGTEHVVEIEVVDGLLTQVVPVPPERAWEISLERDRQLRPGIIYES